jgi:hypothetical protein
MEKPRNRDLAVLQGCIQDPRTSDHIMPPEQAPWINSNNAPDLVALNPLTQFDPLTMWLVKIFLKTYHKLLGKHRKEASDVTASLYLYSDEHIRAPVATLSVVFASVMPVIAITVLYLVHPMGIRLGIIAVFTAGFSFAIASMTKSRRVDNFAATAA